MDDESMSVLNLSITSRREIFGAVHKAMHKNAEQYKKLDLIITSARLTRAPSRPFPDRVMSYAGNGWDSAATLRNNGRSYGRAQKT